MGFGGKQACEHGYQQMLTKDYDGALQTFQEASNLNEISLDIMCGTVDCLLQKGMMDDAALQLEMLTDVMTSAEALSETGCLKFQLLFYRGIPPEEVSDVKIVFSYCNLFCMAHLC